ncbi:MAG: PEGA domain-containing protein [bacterium]
MKNKSNSLRIVAIFLFMEVSITALVLFGCSSNPTKPEEPEVGSIFVDSVPSGANIFLDNAKTGKITPDTLKNVAVGTHTIKLTRNNYADTTLTVTVTANEVTNVSITMFSLAAIYAGNWSGSTSQNLSVNFHVTDEGVIDNLVVRIRLNFFTFTCTGPFSAGENITIEDGKFDATVRNPATNIFTTLHGTFSSSTAVSGDYDGYSGSFSIICGSKFSIGTASPLSAGTWQANKGTTASSALTFVNDLIFNKNCDSCQ